MEMALKEKELEEQMREKQLVDEEIQDNEDEIENIMKKKEIEL